MVSIGPLCVSIEPLFELKSFFKRMMFSTQTQRHMGDTIIDFYQLKQSILNGLIYIVCEVDVNLTNPNVYPWVQIFSFSCILLPKNCRKRHPQILCVILDLPVHNMRATKKAKDRIHRIVLKMGTSYQTSTVILTNR